MGDKEVIFLFLLSMSVVAFSQQRSTIEQTTPVKTAVAVQEHSQR